MTVAGALALVWLARGLAPARVSRHGARLSLTPLVARTDALAIRRSVAVGAIFLLTILVLVGAGLLVGPRILTEASTLAEGLPALVVRIDKALVNVQRELIEAAPVFRAHAARGRELDSPARPASATPGIPWSSSSTIWAISSCSRSSSPSSPSSCSATCRAILTAAMDRLPPHHVETSVAVWRELNGIIGRYIRGVVLDGLVVGVLAALALWAAACRIRCSSAPSPASPTWSPSSGRCSGCRRHGLVVLLTPGQGLGGLVRVIVLFLVIKVLGRHPHPAAHDRPQRASAPGAAARLGGRGQPHPRRARHDPRRAGGHGAAGNRAPAHRAPPLARAAQPAPRACARSADPHARPRGRANDRAWPSGSARWK